ncbi:MAG: LysR substrate-binding domain-containing protein [Gammaproteobacteria bacterium]|nr:LysR substrate-binding domain-containing protein [Gammaproteobacteria bacterium]
MELRQLRSLITLVECDFSVSRTAEKLFLVQSAVSQHITRLEHELGLQLVIRQGKRITGLSRHGQKVLQFGNNMISSEQSILDVSLEQQDQKKGILRIGATHTQARYVLPPVIRAFNKIYPQVELQLYQSNPGELADMALRDIVDMSICTEALASHEGLISMDCYHWNRSVITLPEHPLTRLKKISFNSLCKYPVITYVQGFTGRGHFDNALEKAGLSAHIVLSAADTDVIKTYVREGMGIGIIASMAYDEKTDSGLVKMDLSHLFEQESTMIAYKKDKYIRSYQTYFMQLFQKMAKD